MRNTKILFTVSLFAGAAVALAAGCGSKSSGGNETKTSEDGATSGGEDASGDGAVTGALGTGCSPIALTGAAQLCEPGQDPALTCCVNLANAFAAYTSGGNVGTCTTVTGCTQSVSVQCLAPTDCSGTTPACCGSESGDAGALTAALADAGDASFNADAAISADAAASIASLFSGLIFLTGCATSCSATQYQLCTTTSDCADKSYICAPPGAGFLGGAAGGAGASLGGGISLSEVITISVCQPPDAGTTPPTDSGTTTTPDGSTDAGTTAVDGATTG